MTAVEREARPWLKADRLALAGAGIGQKNEPAGRALTRSTGLNRRRPAAAIAPESWREDLGPCVVCLLEGTVCLGGPVQGHHVIAKSTLKRHWFLEFLFDRRNRLSVCELRHEQHTNGYRPIPRVALPLSVFEFADELGLTWYLDKHYPAGAVA